MKQKTTHPRLLGQDADGKVLHVDFGQGHFSRNDASEVTGWFKRCSCGQHYLRPYRTGTQRGLQTELCDQCWRVWRYGR